CAAADDIRVRDHEVVVHRVDGGYWIRTGATELSARNVEAIRRIDADRVLEGAKLKGRRPRLAAIVGRAHVHYGPLPALDGVVEGEVRHARLRVDGDARVLVVAHGAAGDPLRRRERAASVG